jgi:hypothetical protein
MKVAVFHGINALKCHAELQEAVVIMACCIERLQGGYRLRDVEELQLLMCIAVYILCPFAETCR